MKVYLYDEETGLYEGESFEDSDAYEESAGMTRLPPPPHAPGEVPVFDRGSDSWELIKVTIARQLLNITEKST